MGLRYDFFLQNLDIIQTHNKNPSKTFTMGLNQYSDWSDEEFNKLNGYKYAGEQNVSKAIVKQTPKGDEYKDWRQTEGVVTSVKDQGKCGSCWAFSAITAMEFTQYFFSDQFEDLSTQQLLDCCKLLNSDGCNGGEMIGAYKYYAQGPDPKRKQSQPAVLESEYPYISGTGISSFCDKEKILNTKTEIQGISHYDQVPADAKTLKEAAYWQIMSVAVKVTDGPIRNYAEGIIREADCPTSQSVEDLDHGVAIVGTGIENGIEYFILKNSWGARWGEQGYFRLEIGNTCGVTLQATYPAYRC